MLAANQGNRGEGADGNRNGSEDRLGKKLHWMSTQLFTISRCEGGGIDR
jgi:hypothetical protein